MTTSTILAEKTTQMGKIQVRTLKNIYILDVENIIRCESSRNYTIIYLRNEKSITASHTLKDFENLLPYPMFIRVHQSHLINSNFIKQITRHDAVLMLTDNSKIPMSTRKQELINSFLKSVPGI